MANGWGFGDGYKAARARQVNTTGRRKSTIKLVRMLNGDRYRPRETRSISAFTIRSTRPGRLSSSQDFSIGRSISLTRSSSVRALLLSTVWASVLKADSTADTVECDRIAGAGAAGGASNDGDGSNTGWRRIAR